MLNIEQLEERTPTYNLATPWYGSTITYSYVGEQNASIRAIVENAFNLWAEAAKIRFVELHDSGYVGGFGEDYPIYGNPMIRLHFNANISRLGTAYYPHHPNVNGLAGDIFFRSDATGMYFDYVATHEIGHAIGIKHSDVTGSVMSDVFPTFEGKLTPDDVSAAVALYDRIKQPSVTPTNPFPNFAGEVLRGTVDFNRDRVLDSIFAAQNSQGHIKVFDGRTGAQLLSQSTLPGFFGRITFDSNGEIYAVTAQQAQGHTKVYDGDRASSFLAFPGYLGEVRLDVNDNLQVSANNHVKTFSPEGTQLSSVFVRT